MNFIGGFLNPDGLARPYDIAKHVDYIGEMTGRDKLCVGPDYDYDYNYTDTLLWILKKPKNFPIEIGYATASHMGKPSEVWGLIRELQGRYGWDDDDIRGLLGENLLRLHRANW